MEKLIIDLINKYLPPSTPTAKARMHQTRKKLKSTNQKEPIIQEEPPMIPLSQCTNTVFTNIINHKKLISTNLTGKFPVTSDRGSTYLFVL